MPATPNTERLYLTAIENSSAGAARPQDRTEHRDDREARAVPAAGPPAPQSRASTRAGPRVRKW